MNTEAVADLIHRRNLPLVVFDSCAILDIPRLKYGSETLQILDQCSKRGSDKYTYLLPNQVVREIENHLPKILSNSFDSINKAVSLIVSIESINDVSLESRIQQKRGMIEDAVRDIVSRSPKIDESDQIIFNAMSRLIAKKRPAHASKSSHGDCLVLESLLICASLLRNNGFDKDILFVTTNPQDFSGNMQELKCKPHSDFANEFLDLKILYLTDLRPMFHENSLQKIKENQNLCSAR